MRIDGTARPKWLLRALYWPAKLGQFSALLLVLSAFAYGVYESAATAYYLLRAEPVVGRVSSVESLGRVGGGYREELHFPTIEYHWPATSPDSRWIVGAVPRDDLRTGDRVQVWVLPGAPDMARQEMPLWWHLAVFILLLAGFFAGRQLIGRWYAFDAALGRVSPIRPRRGDGMFQGPAGRRFVVFCGLPALLSVALYLYFVPYLMPNEFAYFFDRPGRLLHIAGARGGPPASGPLNRHERRLLAIPGLGDAVARDGFDRALRRIDHAALERYIAAIADPEIAFEVDMTRLPALLMARPTAILERLLDTGIEVPEAARREMLEIAERQHSEAKLRVLAAHGIRPETATR